MLNKENQSIAAELLSQTADPELMFKQLDDYLANWIGLMQENEHLKENERLKTEHIKALTEACRCILLFHTIIGESTLIKMKSNNEIFILFTCDESKSYASMKCIAASTDIEVIYMAIGKCILNGDMEY